MRFVKHLRVFVNAPSHSRTIAMLIMLIILAAIPLTVIISQRQQELRQRAETDYCADTKINECPKNTVLPDKDCDPKAYKNFKCKITNDDGTYNVYMCQ